MHSATFYRIVQNRNTPSQIFLTGATGSLGAHFALELLSKSTAGLTCLVRAADAGAAERKLEACLRAYDPEFQLCNFSGRLRVLPGDITLPNLGLSDEVWNSEARSTSVTVHAAALTSLVTRRVTSQRVNVQGTKEMIRFAEATQSRRLLHVSTYSVCGDRLLTPGFTFLESHWDVGQAFPHMPYQQSKFLGEGEVRSSSCEWTIVRPGHIFGDSRTGRFFTRGQQSDSFFFDLLKSAHDFGCSFVCDFFFDITPVNYVSEAMLSLLFNGDLGTFHLCQGDALKFEGVLDLMIGMGVAIDKLSIERYRDLLERGSLHWKGKKHTSLTTQVVQKWFHHKELNFQNSGKIDTAATRRVLEPRGIFAPPTGQELLRAYFREPAYALPEAASSERSSFLG